jgi:hypothetical protein
MCRSSGADLGIVARGLVGWMGRRSADSSMESDDRDIRCVRICFLDGRNFDLPGIAAFEEPINLRHQSDDIRRLYRTWGAARTVSSHELFDRYAVGRHPLRWLGRES